MHCLSVVSKYWVVVGLYGNAAAMLKSTTCTHCIGSTESCGVYSSRTLCFTDADNWCPLSRLDAAKKSTGSTGHVDGPCCD